MPAKFRNSQIRLGMELQGGHVALMMGAGAGLQSTPVYPGADWSFLETTPRQKILPWEGDVGLRVVWEGFGKGLILSRIL